MVVSEFISAVCDNHKFRLRQWCQPSWRRCARSTSTRKPCLDDATKRSHRVKRGRTSRCRIPSSRLSALVSMLAWRLGWKTSTCRKASILLQVFFCDRPACCKLRWVSTLLQAGDEREDGCSGGERDEGYSCENSMSRSVCQSI